MGFHPVRAMVTEESFRRASEVLEQQIKPGKKPVPVLVGLLRCSSGATLYVYTRSPDQTCQCKNKISIAALNEIFLGILAEEFTDTGRLGLFAHILRRFGRYIGQYPDYRTQKSGLDLRVPGPAPGQTFQGLACAVCS